MLKNLGWLLLLLAFAAYLVGIVVALVMAFPLGLIGFMLIGGLGLLFLQALLDRLNNPEDAYYAKNVKR